MVMKRVNNIYTASKFKHRQTISVVKDSVANITYNIY